MIKIAAVIVTYNRIELLKKALEAFENQTRLPDYLVVVDNASNDGTYEYLDLWKKNSRNKIVIHNSSNLGGSGGFYTGTEYAASLDVDWIWVSDDDAIPELDVFEKAEKHINSLQNTSLVSAICTQVITDGKIAESNRSRRKMNVFRMSLLHVPAEEYKKNEMFECDNFSYIGVFLNVKALIKVGFINKDYFIWRDDVEHSWRLSEVGKIFCYPDMTVDHKVQKKDYEGISWKTYYAYRNDMIMYKEHKKLVYFISKAVVVIIKSVKGKSEVERKLYLDSLKAAIRCEKGINNEYLPGLKL